MRSGGFYWRPLPHPVEILSLTQQSIGAAGVTYLEHRRGWACGRSDSVLTASLAAVIRAANAP
jgi:2-isopropylmalate synthase